MATTIERSGSSINNLDSIGFYVVAPEEQIRNGVFEKQMTYEGIIEKVRLRIEQYEKDEAKNQQLQEWYERMVQPTIKQINLGC